MMRLLYFIDSLLPGGAERSLAALAPHYISGGIELHVAQLHDRPGLQSVLEDAGANLHSLDGGGGRVGWMRRASQLVGRIRPDLVHTTLFEADQVGRVASGLARLPVVSSLVATPYGQEHMATPGLHPWKVRLAHLVDAATARVVVRFHANSRHVAATMGRRLLIAENRIEVIHRGRDPRELGMREPSRRAAARRGLGLGSRPMILAVARQEHLKGLDLALAAMPHVLARSPQAVLLVAGREGHSTPRLLSDLERLDLGKAVRFLGYRDDVPDLLAAADIFLFPSRMEGMPGAILEAMALEAPIVASDIPSVREALGDNEPTGILVPREDPNALAEAVLAVLAHPARAVELAATARARFLSHFTVAAIADRMMAFYQRALNSARP